ncbi:MAG: LysM peptidoglycan-binding domain-containing protein [Deltaproteobacteria bacterium]|nr:MAG: LysM peptidoglycan-binding domain-containing protein [Deltaproteobacteria bacterium]
MARAILISSILLVVAVVAPATARADECIHVVAKGETLGRIAARAGVRVADLRATDPALAKHPDRLRVGQRIDLCKARKHARRSAKASSRTRKRCGRSATWVEHEVRSGQTLSGIAGRYGVSVDTIVRQNPSLRKNPRALRAGTTLGFCAGRARAKNSKMCGYRTPVYHHEVIPGEHLGVIAGRYGVRRRDLLRWNPQLRANPNALRVGQTIRVCPEIAPRTRQRITHTVASGETFGAIARKYDTTTSQLLAWQRGRLSDPSRLRAGQKLTVWVDGSIVPGFADVFDDEGVLEHGIQLPPGKGYTVKWPAGAWGTAETIRAIQQAVARYQRRMPGGPKVHIGDISKKGGGPFPPHVSHQYGRDVDVGYVLEGKRAHETRFYNASAKNLDVARTWALVDAFLSTGKVKYIFMDLKIQKLLYEHARKKGVSEDRLDEIFQYPRRRRHGIIQHWRGHVNHFHVRFER